MQIHLIFPFSKLKSPWREWATVTNFLCHRLGLLPFSATVSEASPIHCGRIGVLCQSMTPFGSPLPDSATVWESSATLCRPLPMIWGPLPDSATVLEASAILCRPLPMIWGPLPASATVSESSAADLESSSGLCHCLGVLCRTLPLFGSPLPFSA